jgi:hypothetical protein
MVEILALPWRNYARHLADNLSHWLKQVQAAQPMYCRRMN